MTNASVSWGDCKHPSLFLIHKVLSSRWEEVKAEKMVITRRGGEGLLLHPQCLQHLVLRVSERPLQQTPAKRQTRAGKATPMLPAKGKTRFPVAFQNQLCKEILSHLLSGSRQASRTFP